MHLETIQAKIKGIGEEVVSPLTVNDNVLPIVKIKLSENNIEDIASKAQLTHYTEEDRNIAERSPFISEMQYTQLNTTEKYFVSLLKIRVIPGLNINLICQVPMGVLLTDVQ